MGDDVESLARRQWGVFSRRQALAAGVTKTGIFRRLKSGRWLKFDTDVFCFPGPPATWNQKVMGATLALGPQAMASHRTAAWLWELDPRGGAPLLLEVTAPKSSGQRTKRAKVHRTRHLVVPVIRDGIPTTPLARTLLDLSAIATDNELFRAVDAARRKHRLVLTELAKEIATQRAGRGHGPPRLLALIARIGDSPRTDSALEADVAEKLFASALPRPVHQLNIRDHANRFIARVDFAWPAQRVVLFADSRLWHLDPPRWERDLLQRRQLEANGWRVMAATRAMLDTGSGWLDDLGRVLRAVETRHP